MIKIPWRREKTVDPAEALAAGDYAGAAATYRTWIENDPERATTWRKKLAETLALAGDRDGAIAEYMAVAAALEREQRPMQALAIFRAVLRLDPENSDVRARLEPIASEPRTPTRSEPQAGMTIRTRLRTFVPFFSEFEREELTAIVGVMEVRKVRARQVVFGQGDPGDSIYFVAQGEVVLSVEGMDGEAVELETLQPGGYFGEMSALRRTPRNVTATAKTDGELLELRRDYLEALAIACPRIWDVIAHCQRQRATPAGV